MQLVQFGEEYNKPIVVCLGYFGCMHVGHVRLVETAKLLAAECGAEVALFTFFDDVLPIVGKTEKAVFLFDERIDIYRSLGVDAVIYAKFDASFRSSSGEEFLKHLLQYDIKGIVCGNDYTFGCDRCNSDAIAAFTDIQLRVVDTVCLDGMKVSTTLVRKLLSQNEITLVNSLLSQPFFITGRVEHGRHVGSEIGFPTANIAIGDDKFLPEGVFGGYVELDGGNYRCIVNIGTRPTFHLKETCVEAHLIDFEGNLYGKKLKISLTKFLRPITRFADANELKQQLQKDANQVKND